MFIKKEKAQMMVLDIVIAIVLLTIMFFLLNRFVDLKIYNTQSTLKEKELSSISQIAFNNISQNSKINCFISNSDNSFVFRNCFYTDSNINKNSLGLLDNYKCNFSIDSFNILNNSCNDILQSNIDNVYEIDFNVIISDFKYISKEKYLSCIEGSSNCDLNISIAHLKVWYNE
ncbi:MAG: hypothetical protein PHR26_00250 [Candidatus ainarchaeum sp.]|nr:hypothetical protein [Candidatus ainarchaeum sp.]MDD3975646.1 hypothetical protein [Candidatus ainarchaeum sp.]